MLKSSVFIFSLLLYVWPAFTQEILEDKNTGKLYHKTKNAAGEWVISEYLTNEKPSRAQPGTKLTDPDSQSTKSLPPGGGSQSVKEGAPIGYSPTGKPIYQGPKGGEYHWSNSGNKVYHPRGSSSSGRSSGSSGGGRGRR